MRLNSREGRERYGEALRVVWGGVGGGGGGGGGGGVVVEREALKS